jgi:molybdenum cofactor synthesis domain-containing protein
MDKSRSTDGKFRAAVLIASDRSYNKVRPDTTGPKLKKYLEDLGYPVTFLEVVPDDRDAIVATLRKWVDTDRINLILVSGGTGLAIRDVTPEATMEVIERRIPGMEEAMRQASFRIHPHAILSRAVVGCTGESLIIDLPGSPGGALDNLRIIEPALEHALELLSGETPDA